LFNQFDGHAWCSASLPRVTRRIVHPSGGVRLTRAEAAQLGRFTLIWILVLLLAIVAIAGGLALTKFLFILLILAVILALFGARSAA
jgi:hypothetical protein